MTDKMVFAMGAGLAGLGVILGAFGAHGLEPFLAELSDGPKRLENWKTATDYLFVHAVGLMLLGTFPQMCPKFRLIAAFFFVAGVLMFSFGLYGWVRLDQRWMVMIVPIGGLSFIAGWVTTIAAVWFHRESGPCNSPNGCVPGGCGGQGVGSCGGGVGPGGGHA